MEQEILQKIEEQGRKIDTIFASVEKMRRYFFWTLVISIAVIVLPLLALVFVIPQFLSSYGSLLQ